MIPRMIYSIARSVCTHFVAQMKNETKAEEVTEVSSANPMIVQLYQIAFFLIVSGNLLMILVDLIN